ncbi:MAG: transketolase [Myxococcota bacterium]|jgi:transketolase
MSENLEQLAVNTIKGLSMDAVQAANSGHPGAPMGMADMAAVLWGRFLKYDPADPDWADRDRVILSNGHASMLLYSMIHLTGLQDASREGGLALSLEDIQNFRQWGYPTDGHPEYGHVKGIETTTGPLGQGVSNAVGFAMAERLLRERFGTGIVDHFTYAFTGDGCLMEGVSSEACSLAGHLKLGRLVVLYDANEITIDGSTDLSFSESVAGRYTAYGWHVLSVDGHDRDAIAAAIVESKAEAGRPSLIVCRTRIGHGSPNMEGSNKTHGSPLGDAEIRATKTRLGMDPDVTFATPRGAYDYFRSSDAARAEVRGAWEARLAASAERERFLALHAAPVLDEVVWPVFEAGGKIATRAASGAVLQAAAAQIESLIGGSADLAGSNNCTIKGSGFISGADFTGRNIHFGVREHGMAAACSGLVLHGGVRPYCATFMVFHDYMRPSVRLAALMKQPVLYIYTHDSIFLGEDGPTHQPVEHLMAMRAIPNLYVFRPADATETTVGWQVALGRQDGPVALCLTRQKLPIFDRSTLAPASEAAKGGYVLSEAANGIPDVVLIASGSEVSLSLEAQAILTASGRSARVVSMPCWRLFDAQDRGYRAEVLPVGVPRVSIEAGITQGWERYVGLDGEMVGIDRFGASAPGEVVADQLGLNIASIQAAVDRLLGD